MSAVSEQGKGTVQKVAADEYRITTYIDIDATAEEVWSTLTDWENLGSWSSSFLSLDGEFADGGHVTVAFRVLGLVQRYEHDLIEFVPGGQFAWSDPFLLGMVDHHVYRIESTGPSSVRFHQTDRAKGAAARFIGGITARSMRTMYDAFNLELKAETESRRAPGG